MYTLTYTVKDANNDFTFAGNNMVTLSQSADLATRQAVADQYSAPQEDFGSLIAILEPTKQQ